MAFGIFLNNYMYICILVMKENPDELIEITIPPQNVVSNVLLMHEVSCT